MNIGSDALEGHMKRNAALVKELHDRGADLTVPRSVEHHFWAKSQRDAAMFARELYSKGFLILVLARAQTSDPTYSWNIEAGSQETIENVVSRSRCDELVRLAERWNARYDGWGTRI